MTINYPRQTNMQAQLSVQTTALKLPLITQEYRDLVENSDVLLGTWRANNHNYIFGRFHVILLCLTVRYLRLLTIWLYLRAYFYIINFITLLFAFFTAKTVSPNALIVCFLKTTNNYTSSPVCINISWITSLISQRFIFYEQPQCLLDQ